MNTILASLPLLAALLVGSNAVSVQQNMASIMQPSSPMQMAQVGTQCGGGGSCGSCGQCGCTFTPGGYRNVGGCKTCWDS